MGQGKVGNLGELDSGSGAGMTVMQGSLSGRTTGAGDGRFANRPYGGVEHPHPNLPPSVGGREGGVGLTVKVDDKILA